MRIVSLSDSVLTDIGLMKHWNNLTRQEFYHKLGCLFYAIAAADRNVADKEVRTLHRMVLEDWIDLEDGLDEFGTESAFQIETAFDLVRESEWEADKAFSAFEDWFHRHPEVFNGEVISRIYHTASRIAASFRETNKSEMAMLFRIKALLGVASAETAK